MNYFSDEIISGLRTKSGSFQNKFKEIIGDIDEYFDIEDKKREFHRLVEIAHSYDKPGNILFSSKKLFCGNHTVSEHDAICEEIHHFILELFDTEEVMLEVSHIIVAVSMPEGLFNENDAKELKVLISLERLSNWRLTPLVTTIVNDTSHGRTASCFVAALK